MGKHQGKSGRFFKSKTLIILIVAAVLLGAGIAVGYMFYVDYLNVPNFVSSEYNYMVVSKQEARPGDTLTYIIHLANEGRREAAEIRVRTQIPPYTQLAVQDIDYLEEVEQDTICFLIPSLGVGQSKKISFTVEVDSPLDHGTLVTNQGLELSYTRSGSEEVFYEHFAADLETVVISSIDLSSSHFQVTHRGGEHIRMGDVLDVALFVENSGDMTAADIHIANVVPEHTDFVQGSFDCPQASWEQQAVRIEKIEAGQQITLQYAVQVAEHLDDNTKLVFAPVIENSTGQLHLDSQAFMVRAFARLQDFTLTGVQESAGDLNPQDTIQYSISFTNTGDGKAADVVVENQIPQHTTFLGMGTDAYPIQWQTQGSVFHINIPELGPGETFRCDYRVQVNPGTYLGTPIANTSTLIYEGQNLKQQSVSHTVISSYSYQVAVMGDSQVANTQWTAHLQKLFTQSYPYGTFQFSKSGRGGETVDMGYNRMVSSGILGQKPYIFILNYGTNDATTSYGYFRIAPETYRHYLGAMIDAIKSNTGALVVVMSTGAVDESVDSAHTNAGMAIYNQVAAQVCAQKGAVFVDVFNPMLATGNPGQFLSDGLHYNSAGDQLVARIAFNTISGHLNPYGTR